MDTKTAIICIGCGTEFVPTGRYQQHCSMRCKEAFAGRARGGESNKFCSRPCYFADKREKGRLKTAAALDATREAAKKLSEAHAVSNGIYRKCLHCGDAIDKRTEGGNRLCDLCRDQARRDQRALTRARLRAKNARHVSGDETVKRKVLFVRDRYQCWICLGPCRPKYDGNDPACATIDHVILRSKGGPHSYANCRTAHLICNSYKNDAVDPCTTAHGFTTSPQHEATLTTTSSVPIGWVTTAARSGRPLSPCSANSTEPG